MDVILRIFASVDTADACARPKTETAMTIESDIRPEDYGRFPSPCYIVEERLLRRNLQLIRDTSLPCRLPDDPCIQGLRSVAHLPHIP